MSQVTTPWTWNFPPIANPPAPISRQLAHVCSEVTEAEDAFRGGESAERVAEELLDTIHAAETALRMLGVEMDEAKRAVIEKNDARGYYGGDYGNTR